MPTHHGQQNTDIKTAVSPSTIIGAMAMFAGGQVVLGKAMDYYVIDLLPVYNLIIGLISAFLTAIIMWRGSRLALPVAIATFASLTAVMLILQTVYRDVVAPDSIQAMTLRLVVWLIVLALMIIPVRKNKLVAN